MKHFNAKLINFNIVLTLSPLLISTNCSVLARKIIDQYKQQLPKETLEEKDREAMVKNLKEAVDRYNSDSDTPSAITLLESLNIYSERVKKNFFDLEKYDNYTLLGYAILKNKYNVVKKLLEEPSVDVNKVFKGHKFYSIQLALANKSHGSSVAIMLLESPKSKELDFTAVVPTIAKENETKEQATKNNILHQAIINDYFDLAQRLVSKDNKPKLKSILNQRNHNNDTPLQLAIDKYLGCVRDKKDKSDTDNNNNVPYLGNKNLSTRLYVSLPELIKDLLELEQINLTDIKSNTWSDFIKTAYQNQDKKLIGLLVKHKNAPITEIAKQAIKHKDEKLLQLLANNDTINLFSISYPLSKKANDPPTLLYELVKENQPDQVKLLIKYFGIGHRLFKDRDIKPEPILEKAIDRYITYLNNNSSEYLTTREIILVLLEDLNKSNPNSTSLNCKNTAFWVRIINKEATDGQKNLIQLLANHRNFKGSSIDKALQEYQYTDKNGHAEGLLHKAVRDNDLKKVQILTNFPALINLQNRVNKEEKDDTALHMAVRVYGKKEKKEDKEECKSIIEHLIKLEYINVNIQNNLKNTPLHLAACDGFSEIVQILLKKNPDKTIKGQDNLTPYGMARRYRNHHLADLLKIN